MSADPEEVIRGAIVIAIGAVLLPIVALFLSDAAANGSVASFAGVPAIVTLIMYGFAFGLVFVGLGMVIKAARK